MRWLHHLVEEGVTIADPYAPPSLAAEGFVHASYRDDVAESARLHFAPGARLRVLRLDPRRLAGMVREDATPRGPMPHVHGAIPKDAIAGVHAIDEIGALPDPVTGTRVAFVAFDGMTWLDLVGCWDPVSRIASMGFDPTTTVAIVGATSASIRADGAELRVERVRPDLADFDLVVVPGGLGARTLVHDRAVVDWLARFPPNRRLASVCTGALLLGAAGRLRGRRATTHHSAFDLLAEYGAHVLRERVVVDGPIATAGGVTSGIDLGLSLVAWLAGAEVARRIAAQMEIWPELVERVLGSAS